MDAKLRDELTTLDILPISKVIVAKRSSNPGIEWIRFDVYRLGVGDYGLEWSRLDTISRNNVTVSQNFPPSRRLNLKGVSIICGLVVSSFSACIERFLFSISN